MIRRYILFLTICMLLFTCPSARAQFLVEGEVFTNFGRINYYGPFTEITSESGSRYEANFSANFDHFETDPVSLRIHNNYDANGSSGGSSDNFLGPSGEPGEQGVGGTVAPNFWKLVLQNGSSSVFRITNTAGANVFSNVAFQNGITTTVRSNKANGALRFQNGATYTGGTSDNQHVDGYVSKVGNQAFKFPVGSNGDSRTLTMNAPTSPTAVISVAYQASNVQSASAIASPITSVFTQASWEWIPRTAADDNGLGISVSTPNLSAFAARDELRLIGWNGAQWIDISGNSNATGNAEGSTLSGTIPAGVNITRIGIGAAPNSLPVTLSSFSVNEENNSVFLSWSTTKEINSDYFEIQRSLDASNWRILDVVKAEGESATKLQYSYLDSEPYSGVNYYRLRMVDLDNSFAFSSIRSAQISSHFNIVLSPNPFVDKLHLSAGNIESLQRMQLISASGKIVLDIEKQNNLPITDILDLGDLSAGIYHVRMEDIKGEVTSQKVIKR